MKTNPRKKWLDQTILHQIEKNRTQEQTRNDYLQRNAYFVTMTFDPGTVIAVQQQKGHSRTSTNVQWDQFSFLYKQICRELVGPRFNKPKNVELLPYVLAALDAEGSRQSGLVDERDLSNLHIHAIWLNHPGHKDQFEAFIRSLAFKLRFRSKLYADALVFDQFDPERGSIENLFGYTTKLFWRDRGQLGFDDIIRIYPDANYGSKGAYRQTDVYEPGSRIRLAERSMPDRSRRDRQPAKQVICN